MGSKSLLSALFIVLASTHTICSRQYEVYKQFDDNHREQSYELSKRQEKVFLTLDNGFPRPTALRVFIEGKVPSDILAKNTGVTTLVPLVKKEMPTPIPRKSSDHKNVLLILTLITLMVLAYIKITHVDIWKQYMKWSWIISLKDRAGIIYKFTPFERRSLLMVFAYALLSANAILGLFYFSTFSWKISAHFLHSNIFIAISKWFELVLFLLAIVFAKYVLINLFTRLFDLKKASRIHFYNHVRISMMMVSILLIVEFVVIFGFQNTLFTDWLEVFLIGIFILRSLLISIKLIKINTYRMFHLFLYLCATELIPTIVLVKSFFFT